MRRAPGILLFGFICLFWNGIVGVFDVVILSGLFNETRARTHFVPTTGHVTSSGVETHYDSDGSTYEAQVEYTYEYEGQTYTGDRIAYTVFATSDSGAAETTAERYPEGATIDVLVDPDDPSESVLDVSGEQLPAGVILFLTPFHCIGFALFCGLVLAIRSKSGSEEDKTRARFVKVDDERHLVIAKPMWHPIAMFLLVLGIASFVATFPVIFLLGFNAPLKAVLATLGACVALAGYFAWRRIAARRSPRNYVHVDRRLGVFSYPADSPGEPIENVREVRVSSTATSTSINEELQYDHCIEVETTSGPIELFDFRSGQDDGERLRRLLEAELLPA